MGLMAPPPSDSTKLASGGDRPGECPLGTREQNGAAAVASTFPWESYTCILRSLARLPTLLSPCPPHAAAPSRLQPLHVRGPNTAGAASSRVSAIAHPRGRGYHRRTHMDVQAKAHGKSDTSRSSPMTQKFENPRICWVELYPAPTC